MAKLFVSNYQQLPKPLILGMILSRLKEVVSFGRHFPSDIRCRMNNKENLNKLKEKRNAFKGRDFLLIGNGPSARNLSAEQINFFQEKGGHVGVVNDFFRSQLAQEIKPNYLFLADPSYWWQMSYAGIEKEKKRHIQSFDKNSREKLLNYIESQSQLVVVQPLRQPKINNKHEHFLFTDTFNVQGIGRFSNPIGFWSYPFSVALIAISVAKFMGYERIYFAGLDFSHFLNFVVDDFNNVLFSTSGVHFYSARDLPEHNHLLSLEGLPIRNYGDVHFAAAIHHKDLKLLCGEVCVNVGLDSTNDVANRACLTKASKS